MILEIKKASGFLLVIVVIFSSCSNSEIIDHEIIQPYSIKYSGASIDSSYARDEGCMRNHFYLNFSIKNNSDSILRLYSSFKYDYCGEDTLGPKITSIIELDRAKKYHHSYLDYGGAMPAVIINLLKDTVVLPKKEITISVTHGDWIFFDQLELEQKLNYFLNSRPKFIFEGLLEGQVLPDTVMCW